jgi:hypothetical protein
MDQPHTTVLHDRINLFCFDVVDLDTLGIISGEVRNSVGARVGDPAFAAVLGRECSREFPSREDMPHDTRMWVPTAASNAS